MPDPVARKRLKKRMLDRWENEGGSIISETSSEDPVSTGSKRQAGGKKKSSSRDKSSTLAPAPTGKTRKPTRK